MKGLAVACLVLLSGPTTSRAASHTWTNKTTGVQDWNTVANWDGGGVYASDPADVSSGLQYPLLEVAGGVPPGVPAIDGVVGTLRWSGAGNGTLVLDTTPSGTLIIIR